LDFFAVPMKFVQRWKYENIWLVFALSGLVVFPWLLTATTVPHLGAVYRLTSTHSIIAITGFGLCWGAGATQSAPAPHRKLRLVVSKDWTHVAAAYDTVGVCFFFNTVRKLPRLSEMR